MASRMAEPDRKRLAQLLGMVGSTQDGEALNAARLAHRMVQRLNLSWADVLDPPPPVSTAVDLESYNRGLAQGYQRGLEAGLQAWRMSAKPPGPHQAWGARPPPPPEPEVPEQQPWQREASELLEAFPFPLTLTRWEREFLGAIEARAYPLTPKQQARMAEIREKCARASPVGG